MKLLVVDDQEAVCNIVAQIAAQGGWECMYTTQVDDILQLVRKEKVDVLLMDYLMPGLDGLEAAEVLRQNGEQLPIIIFSGASGEIDMQRARRASVMHVLAKPLDIPELRRTLSRAANELAEKNRS